MLLLAALVSVLYFTSDFSLIDIQKTAIIVALGIDKIEDQFEVTVQIAIPQATDQTAANDDSTISTFGKTVYEAIDNIGTQTGWAPKLAFCDLILFGRSMTEENVMPVVDYIVASRRIQNSAVLAACEGSAKEILLSVTALDAISAFAIQKILLKKTLSADNVINTDVRRFASTQLSDAKTSYIPLIKTKKTDDKGKESGSSSSQMASTGGSSGGSEEDSGSGGENKNVVFDATETAVFVNGKTVCTLSPEETKVFCMIRKPVEESFLIIDAGEGKKLISINGKRSKIGVSFNEKPTLNLSLTLSAEIIDGAKTPSLTNMTDRTNVSTEELASASEKVTDILNGMLDKLKEANADIFGAKENVYKFHHSRYESVKDLHLKNFDYSVNVAFKSEE